MLENITEILELEGFDVLGAADGEQGLELARKQRPDLIICDIMMPRLDGYGVLLALRGQPETAAIPFILLTAKADRMHMRHGMELGADDYLTKPFSAVELIAAVHARLAKHQAIARESEKSLERAKHRLMQTITHELRTPLVSINTVMEIISRQLGQLSPEQLRELLDSMSAGSKRLSRLVEQIVLITQLESGLLTREGVARDGLPVRVSEIILAAVDLARRFAYRHPDVIVRVDERDQESTVLCDTRALKHALAELISNALGFSPEGSEVMIAQWRADDRAWISIVDSGPGMSPEQVAQALGAFQQIDRETQEQQGVGLGLPLARQIIEAHGGTFELSSVEGRGTQVVISLPVYAGEEAMWGSLGGV